MTPETARLLWMLFTSDTRLDACMRSLSDGEIAPWTPGNEATAVNLGLAAKFLRDWADGLETK